MIARPTLRTIVCFTSPPAPTARRVAHFAEPEVAVTLVRHSAGSTKACLRCGGAGDLAAAAGAFRIVLGNGVRDRA